jgi:hypothetical protein
VPTWTSSPDDHERIYRRGAPVADIVEAVPRLSNVGDQCLKEQAVLRLADLLSKARPLFCE